MKQSRMYALDGARGIAAFSILLFHVSGNRISAFGNLYIAVDFFFVLSGFVLAPAVAKVKNIVDARKFLILRFIRIFPMVLAILLFTALYDLAIIVKRLSLGEEVTSPIILSIPTLLFSLLMLQIFYAPAILVDYPVWSLSAEWVANIIVTITQSFVSKSKYISLMMGALIIIASVAFKFETLNQLGRAIWGFSLGLIAFDLQRLYFRFRKQIWFSSLFLLPVLLSASNLGGYESLLSTLPFVALILIFAQMNAPLQISKLFSIAGKYSYGFYLWHFPLLGWVGFFLNQLDFDPKSIRRMLLEIGLTSILSVIATKMSLSLIEDPIRRYWGNRLRLV